MPSITRRTFLTAAPACAAQAAKRAPRPKQVIDTHTHFYDPTRPQGVPWPGKNEPLLYRPRLPAGFLEVAKPFGITGTVVVEASPWLEDNQWVIDLAKENPVIVGLVGHLNPGRPGFKDHVTRFSKDPLFRGIRTGSNLILEPRDQRLLDDDLKRMADVDWVLDLNGNSSQFETMLRLVDRVPQLRVVIEHLPYDPPKQESERAASAAALRELGKRPQVFAKISNVLRRVNGSVREDLDFYRPLLDQLWSCFGQDHVVYASNWPVSDMYAPYANNFRLVAVYFAEKGQEAVDKFFFENSRPAFKWVKRG